MRSAAPLSKAARHGQQAASLTQHVLRPWQRRGYRPQDTMAAMPHYPPRQKIRPINPRKLGMSKWTAVTALNKEKHFLVTGVVAPASPELPIESVELQAILSGRSVVLPWRDLQDAARWHQGWV